jgi:hypothetical protein
MVPANRMAPPVPKAKVADSADLMLLVPRVRVADSGNLMVPASPMGLRVLTAMAEDSAGRMDRLAPKAKVVDLGNPMVPASPMGLRVLMAMAEDSAGRMDRLAPKAKVADLESPMALASPMLPAGKVKAEGFASPTVPASRMDRLAPRARAEDSAGRMLRAPRVKVADSENPMVPANPTLRAGKVKAEVSVSLIRRAKVDFEGRMGRRVLTAMAEDSAGRMLHVLKARVEAFASPMAPASPMLRVERVRAEASASPMVLASRMDRLAPRARGAAVDFASRMAAAGAGSRSIPASPSIAGPAARASRMAMEAVPCGGKKNLARVVLRAKAGANQRNDRWPAFAGGP